MDVMSLLAFIVLITFGLWFLIIISMSIATRLELRESDKRIAALQRDIEAIELMQADIENERDGYALRR